MATRKIDVSISVELPDNWQLYNEPGKDKAENALNEALLVSYKHIAENKCRAKTAYNNHMRPVMEKYSSFGACDTEVKDLVMDCLEDFSGEYKHG